MSEEKQKDAIQVALKSMLFQQVNEDRACALLRFLFERGKADYIRFGRGDVLYSPDEYRRSLGILITGKACVEKGGVLLNTLESGECFGAAALFADSRRYVSTVRTKGGCSVLFLPQDAMRWLFEEEPQISVNYIAFLSGRIQFLNRKIDSFTAPSAEETLLDYLREQAVLSGGIFRLPVPMAKLAEMLNIGRTSLYRAFEELERKGLVCREGRMVHYHAEKKERK